MNGCETLSTDSGTGLTERRGKTIASTSDRCRVTLNSRRTHSARTNIEMNVVHGPTHLGRDRPFHITWTKIPGRLHETIPIARLPIARTTYELHETVHDDESGDDMGDLFI